MAIEEREKELKLDREEPKTAKFWTNETRFSLQKSSTQALIKIRKSIEHKCTYLDIVVSRNEQS